MVTSSITLSDPWPRFQGCSIFSKLNMWKRCKTAIVTMWMYNQQIWSL